MSILYLIRLIRYKNNIESDLKQGSQDKINKIRVFFMSILYLIRLIIRAILRVTSSRAAKPLPLSPTPGEPGTVSQWAPITVT